MGSHVKLFTIFQAFFLSAFSQITVHLPYTTCEIDDSCIEDIISSAPYQRLHYINQYGIGYYNHTKEHYTRFDHCVGVYNLLKKANAPYLEQIAGLLHDASHTAFSHFGDYFFKSHEEDSWQDLNHNEFLEKIGLKEIIEKHNLRLDSIYHKNKSFIALDKPLPDLCADRLEYNLSGAFKHLLITEDEARRLYDDVEFKDGYWSFSDIPLAEKLANASIIMMEEIWSCPVSHVSNLVLCKVISHAISKGIMTVDEVVFKTDDEVMKKLSSSNCAFIDKGMKLIYALPELINNGNDYHYDYKCRAIDPYIRTQNGLKRLSESSCSYKDAFLSAQKRARQGRLFSIPDDIKHEYKDYLEDLVALETSSRL
jgi:uncharacterized protein